MLKTIVYAKKIGHGNYVLEQLCSVMHPEMIEMLSMFLVTIQYDSY